MGDFANVRLAVGLTSPYFPDEKPADVFQALGDVTTAELKKRFRDVFKQTDGSLDAVHERLANVPARLGMRAYVAVSRLVPTAEFENVRVDAEISTYVDPDETIADLFERHFAEVSSQIKPLLAGASGAKTEKASRGPARPATSFDWS